MQKSGSIFVWLAIAGFLIFYAGSAVANENITATGISNNQLQKIIDYENFSATAYPDGSANGVQLYSIGYGHQIGLNEQYLMTSSITPAQAQQLLLNDLQPVISVINSSGINFDQGQIDGLADFGYSAGIGALNNAIAAFQTGGVTAAAAVIQQYVYWHPVPGGPAVLNNNLVNRRNDEINSLNN